jgi:hypothetical protein
VDGRRHFAIGELVDVLNEKKNDSLQNRLDGPFRVIGKLGFDTYLLEGPKGIFPRPVNVRRMIKHVGKSEKFKVLVAPKKPDVGSVGEKEDEGQVAMFFDAPVLEEGDDDNLIVDNQELQVPDPVGELPEQPQVPELGENVVENDEINLETLKDRLDVLIEPTKRAAVSTIVESASNYIEKFKLESNKASKNTARDFNMQVDGFMSAGREDLRSLALGSFRDDTKAERSRRVARWILENQDKFNSLKKN